MSPTVLAAVIGVGGTVIIGIAGFGASIWNTRKTIGTAREARIWDRRAGAAEAGGDGEVRARDALQVARKAADDRDDAVIEQIRSELQGGGRWRGQRYQMLPPDA